MNFRFWPLGLAIVAALTMVSCSHTKTRIFPKKDNHALAITTSMSESSALDDNLEKSQEWCLERGKHMELLNKSSKYQGMDKNAKGAIGVIGALTGKPTYTNSKDDYRVETTFRCM